jgi:hypothetical protein
MRAVLIRRELWAGIRRRTRNEIRRRGIVKSRNIDEFSRYVGAVMLAKGHLHRDGRIPWLRRQCPALTGTREESCPTHLMLLQRFLSKNGRAYLSVLTLLACSSRFRHIATGIGSSPESCCTYICTGRLESWRRVTNDSTESHNGPPVDTGCRT